MSQAPGQYTVIYDGRCPICVRSVGILKDRDSRGVLSLLPSQDPAVAREFSHISPDALEASIHLVGPGGEIREGVDAVETLLAVLPGSSWLGWMFRVPLVRPVARQIYRFVARNRYRLTCGRHCSNSGPTGPS